MKELLRAVSGLIVWAATFALLYGLEGLACAESQRGSPAFGRLALILPWAGALGVLGWMTWYFASRRQGMPFLDRLAVGSAATGLAATLYTGVPILAASRCLG